MNAQFQEIESVGELSVVERASRAMSKAESETRLKELAEASKSLVAITDNAQREAVHEARMTLKEIRVRIEKTGKAAREDATAYSKAVIAEEKRLIALIEPEESRLAAIQKEWDDRKERERQAKIEAELKRIESIQIRIAELRGSPHLSPTHGSKLIAEHIADLSAISVDGTFDEFVQQASDAKTAALARLQGILNAAIEHEAEQERIKAERAELARLRAEQAERDRIAAEERAKAEAAAKAERDAEAARVAEENRRERERLAAERAENERIAREAREKTEAEAKAERDRIAAEEAAARAVRDAEAKKLADERAELERQQAEIDRQKREAEEARLAEEAAKKAADKAKAAKAKNKRFMPSREAILLVLADHYGESNEVVEAWLKVLFGTTS